MSFLIGLLLFAATAAAIYVAKMTYNWLRSRIGERLNKAKSGTKVITARTKDLFDVAMKEKMQKTHGVSYAEMDKLCAEHPYVMANYDVKHDSLEEYATYKTDSVSDKVRCMLKNGDGMIVIGE